MAGAVTLAATTAARAREVLLHGAIMLGVVLVLAAVLFWLRRRLHPSRPRRAAESFSMADIEALRADGQISDEEFRRVRRGLLGLSAAGEKAETGLSRPSEDDDGTDERSGDNAR